MKRRSAVFCTRTGNAIQSNNCNARRMLINEGDVVLAREHFQQTTKVHRRPSAGRPQLITHDSDDGGWKIFPLEETTKKMNSFSVALGAMKRSPLSRPSLPSSHHHHHLRIIIHSPLKSERKSFEKQL